MSKPSLSAQLDRDFDRIFGDAWQPTIPNKPDPLPTREATPVPEWPRNEGVEP